MRISDWSLDVCSSDLDRLHGTLIPAHGPRLMARKLWLRHQPACSGRVRIDDGACRALAERGASLLPGGVVGVEGDFSNHALVDLVSRQGRRIGRGLVEYHASDLQRIAGRHSQEIEDRSEEQTSELQSLMRISYAVFCLKKKKHKAHNQSNLKK